MADLRVITLLPAQSVTGIQTPPGAPGVHGGAAGVGKLPAGTILSGFIVNRDASGNPILRTTGGDVPFSSNFFLNIGSEVTIRIEAAPGGTLAHILSVDGQPPEIAAGLSAFAQEPEVIMSPSLAPPPATGSAVQSQAAAPAIINAAQPQASITVKGTVIAPPPVAAPPLPAGTELTLAVKSIAAAPVTLPEDILALIAPSEGPAAAPAPAPLSTSSYAIYARATGAPPTPALPATPAAAAPAVTGNIPATPLPASIPASTIAPAVTVTSAAPAALPPAATPPAIASPPPPIPVTADIAAAPPAPAVPVVPVAAQPQAFAATAASAAAATPIPVATVAPQPGQPITGTVLASSTAGETLVQTPVGVVQLAGGTQLPPGSQVTFTVTQVTPPAAPAAALSSTPAPITALAQHWASLQRIFLLLASRSDAALGAVQNLMPSLPALTTPQAAAPPPFSAGLMLFVAALKDGDFTNWLGHDNVQWLQDQGQGDLVKRAAAEFSAMSRQFAEPVPDRWQALFFPVAVAGEVQQARLFVKRDRKQSRSDPGKKTDDTRFVVEVDLSRLGELQMDGFVRKQPQDVQFDLVIRSTTPLPPEVQQDILSIYNDAGQITGYKGALTFQTVRHFPINPMEDLIAQTSGTMA